MFKRVWAILALLTALHVAADVPRPAQDLDLQPQHQQEQAALLAADLLSRYHYKPLPLDEPMSGRIFDRYVKAMDPDKLFFSQADVDLWHENRGKLSDAIRNEDLSIPFAMFNLYRRRAFECFAYARSLLKEGFDFNAKESYQYAKDDDPRARSVAEIHELWRKRAKNDWLRLKLAGKDASSIVETLDKRYES